jgi:DNA-3-methyladenine glycosylase II
MGRREGRHHLAQGGADRVAQSEFCVGAAGEQNEQGRLVESQPDLDPRAWLSTLPAFDAFGTLLWQVLGQQISVAAWRAILGRLQSAFGRVPTPAQILDADPTVLLEAGLSRRKIKTLKAIAAEFAAGSIRSDELATMSDSEIETRLTSINGVGPWTVHGFLIIALDRPDVVLPGDVALHRAIQREYELKERPSRDEVRALADRWRPNRTLASAYLFAASSALARATARSPEPPRRHGARSSSRRDHGSRERSQAPEADALSIELVARVPDRR